MVVLLITDQQPDGGFGADAEALNGVVAEFCHTRNIPVADPLGQLKRLSNGTPRFRNAATTTGPRRRSESPPRNSPRCSSLADGAGPEGWREASGLYPLNR